MGIDCVFSDPGWGGMNVKNAFLKNRNMYNIVQLFFSKLTLGLGTFHLIWGMWISMLFGVRYSAGLEKSSYSTWYIYLNK